MDWFKLQLLRQLEKNFLNILVKVQRNRMPNAMESLNKFVLIRAQANGKFFYSSWMASVLESSLILLFKCGGCWQAELHTAAQFLLPKTLKSIM